MARIDTLNHFLTDVADSIREKKGTSGQILASNFDTEIASISGGGEVTYPVAISYNFANQIAGNAKGTITLSTTDSSTNGNYKLYWANDNGIMENHSAINTMTLALSVGANAVYDKFNDVNMIPKYATKVVACKEGTYTVLGKFDIPSAKLFASGNYGEHSYSFGALADIHLPTTPDENPLAYATFETAGTDFASALLWFNNRENVSHTNIAGDITCTSIKGQCDTYKAIRDICSNAIPVRFALGNHDVGYNHYLADNVATYNNSDGKYFSKTVGDDVFAFVSVYANSKTADLFPIEELIWLEDLLEINRNKRVFVFTHVPPHYQLCAGFSNPDGIYDYDIWGKGSSKRADRGYIEQIMARYKNSIWFFGHTHIAYYMQERNTNCNYYRWNTTGARMFHVSSCSVPRDASLADQRTELEGKSEGYVVDVYPNTILVRGREFADNFYIGLAQYIVDTTIESISARLSPIVPRETPKVLESISVQLLNPTVEQHTTYTPNAIVTAHYDDASTEDVTASASFGTIDTSTAGNKTLTVSYTEDGVTKTATATVTVTAEPVQKVLSSISATKTKVNYEVGENFDVSDVVVRAFYSNSTSEVVTSSATIGTVDTSTAGSKTLNISYTEDGVTKTDTITITVSEPAPPALWTWIDGMKLDSQTGAEIPNQSGYGSSTPFDWSGGSTATFTLKEGVGSATIAVYCYDNSNNFLGTAVSRAGKGSKVANFPEGTTKLRIRGGTTGAVPLDYFTPDNITLE